MLEKKASDDTSDRARVEESNTDSLSPTLQNVTREILAAELERTPPPRYLRTYKKTSGNRRSSKASISARTTGSQSTLSFPVIQRGNDDKSEEPRIEQSNKRKALGGAVTEEATPKRTRRS
jgi:hypothetical protein